MADDLKLALRLTADGKGFVGEVRVAKRELRELTATTGGAERGARRYSAATATAERTTSELGRTVSRAHRRVLEYGAAYLGVTQGLAAARGLARTADTYTRVTNTLRLATEGQDDYAAAYRRVIEIAGDARAPLEETSTLYQRIALASEALGATQEDVFAAVSAAATAAAIDGGNASGALLQLGQAFGNVNVQAEEFNSLIDGMPSLLRAASAQMGITTAELRRRVVEGELSSRDFFSAVVASAAELEAQMGRTTVTIGQAMSGVGSSTTVFVGELDAALDATSRFTGALGALADGIDAVDAEELAADLGALLIPALALTALQAGRVALRIAGPGGMLLSMRRSAREAVAAEIALARYSTALRIAEGRSRAAALAVTGLSRVLGVLAGPGGWVLLAGYALYELTTDADEATRALRALGDAADIDLDVSDIETMTAKLRDLTRAQRELLILSRRRALDQQPGLLAALGIGADPGLRQRLAAAEDDLAQAQRYLEHVEALSFPAGAPVPEHLDASLVAERVTEAQALVDALRAEVERAEAELAALEATAARVDLEGADLPLPVPGAGSAATRVHDTYGVAADATDEFRRLQAQLRTEAETVAETFAAQVAVIEANTRAGSRAREELRSRAGAARDAALEALRLRDAEAAAREATRTGAPALAALRRRSAELAAVTDVSAESLERQAAETRALVEAQQAYPGASAATIRAIVDERLAVDAATAALERRSGAFERVKRAELRYREEIAALESLRGDARVDQGLLDAEIARLEEDAVLEVRRAAWERELLERQGFQSRVEAEEAAHRERLIDIDYRYAEGVGSVLKLVARFERETGRERAATALEAFQQISSAFGGQSRRAFRIAQAAAIAQAVIATIQGVQEAWRSGLQITAPAPIPQIAAATFATAAAAQGYARVAEIRAQQPPQAYARGGVVEGATWFGARGLPAGGLAGEAGPEAILPLTRMPGGNLGVEARARAAPTLVFAPSIRVEVVVGAGDADAQSIGDATGERLGDELRALFDAFVADAQRSGGVLNPTNAVG